MTQAPAQQEGSGRPEQQKTGGNIFSFADHKSRGSVAIAGSSPHHFRVNPADQAPTEADWWKNRARWNNAPTYLTRAQKVEYQALPLGLPHEVIALRQRADAEEHVISAPVKLSQAA